MKIISEAPCRVDLAGGTLDIWPLYLFHPGAVTLNFANEGKVIETWKLDIPDTISKDDLAAALLRQVKLVEQEAAKWPSDQYEAYRMVAQQILEAFSTPVVALK